MSDFIIVEITAMFTLAGPYIAQGLYYGYNKIDWRIYFLYLLFAIIVPIGLISGKRISIKTSSYNYSVSDKLLYLMMLFTLLYCSMFLYTIRDSIPLFLLLKGEGATFVKIARLQTTDSLRVFYDVPLIFRYKDIVFGVLVYFLFSILHVKYLMNKKKYKSCFWLYFLSTLLFVMYSTEKAPLLYLIIIIIFNLYAVKIKSTSSNIDNLKYTNKYKRIIISVIVIGLTTFVFIYTFFMGIENIEEAITSVFKRAFVGQSCGTYIQMQMLDSFYNGSLNGDGIALTFIDSILDRKIINLSRIGYAEIFSSYAEVAGPGTIGTMPMFYFYSNFGWIISFVLVFLISFLTGILDKRQCRIVSIATDKTLPIAIYSVLVVFFIQGYMGNMSVIFQFPFIIAPNLFAFYIFICVFKYIKL